MEINGVAHTFITVGDFTAARAFYGQLLPFLVSVREVVESDESFVIQEMRPDSVRAATDVDSRKPRPL
jgi:hypothetical protein